MKVLDISITVKEKLWKPHFYEFLMKINPYRSFANGVKVLFFRLRWIAFEKFCSYTILSDPSWQQGY